VKATTPNLDFTSVGDPDNDPAFGGIAGKGIVISTGLSATEEHERLENAYANMTQVTEYNAAGPNSNTFLHQLLIDAGFTVTRPPGARGGITMACIGMVEIIFDLNGKPKPNPDRVPFKSDYFHGCTQDKQGRIYDSGGHRLYITGGGRQ
jgi:hypothetical protein